MSKDAFTAGRSPAAASPAISGATQSCGGQAPHSRIDLYQFHWPDAIGTAVEDSWGEMVRLIEEGKVLAGGRG